MWIRIILIYGIKFEFQKIECNEFCLLIVLSSEVLTIVAIFVISYFKMLKFEFGCLDMN